VDFEMSMTTTQQPPASELAFEDQQALAEAVRLLEFTSLASRLTNIVGTTIGAASNLLPFGARTIVTKAVETALSTAMRSAIRTIRTKTGPVTTMRHKSLAALSGAAGGAFGIAALPVELPVSTVLILRAIADIARTEGEDLHDPATALNCMEVFALGGTSHSDDNVDSGYFAVRAVLAKSVTDAAKFLAAQGTANNSAPVLIKFISEIAARFGIVVTQKAAAQAVPVIGAIAGAGINYAFMAHFQGLARGHFTVRRLERLYGPEIVRTEYERLALLWRDVQSSGKDKRA
jgi:hypothetical protein